MTEPIAVVESRDEDGYIWDKLVQGDKTLGTVFPVDGSDPLVWAFCDFKTFKFYQRATKAEALTVALAFYEDERK